MNVFSFNWYECKTLFRIGGPDTLSVDSVGTRVTPSNNASSSLGGGEMLPFEENVIVDNIRYDVIVD